MVIHQDTKSSETSKNTRNRARPKLARVGSFSFYARSGVLDKPDVIGMGRDEYALDISETM